MKQKFLNLLIIRVFHFWNVIWCFDLSNFLHCSKCLPQPSMTIRSSVILDHPINILLYNNKTFSINGCSSIPDNLFLFLIAFSSANNHSVFCEGFPSADNTTDCDSIWPCCNVNLYFNSPFLQLNQHINQKQNDVVRGWWTI